MKFMRSLALLMGLSIVVILALGSQTSIAQDPQPANPQRDADNRAFEMLKTLAGNVAHMRNLQNEELHLISQSRDKCNQWLDEYERGLRIMALRGVSGNELVEFTNNWVSRYNTLLREIQEIRSRRPAFSSEAPASENSTARNMQQRFQAWEQRQDTQASLWQQVLSFIGWLERDLKPETREGEEQRTAQYNRIRDWFAQHPLAGTQEEISRFQTAVTTAANNKQARDLIAWCVEYLEKRFPTSRSGD